MKTDSKRIEEAKNREARTLLVKKKLRRDISRCGGL